VLSFPMPSGIRHKTVSSRLIRNFMRKAQRIGIEETAFCQLTGITADDLHASDGRLAGDKHMRMLRLEDRLPFSLQDLPPRTLEQVYTQFPELATLWSLSRTPRQGVERFVENRCLIGELDSVALLQTDDSLSLVYINEAGLPRSCASALSNFALVLCILHHHLGRAACRVDIELQGELAVPAALIGEHLDARVHFHCAHNRLICQSGALDVVSRHHQPLAERHLQTCVADMRSRLANRESFLQQVRATLESRMRTQNIADDCEQALTLVCGQFGISRWTLLRRLKQEGCTFQWLWTRLRAEEARRLLSETKLSISEVSERLGFGSQSSLSRFFKTHWGVTPARYRAARQPCNTLTLPLPSGGVQNP